MPYIVMHWQILIGCGILRQETENRGEFEFGMKKEPVSSILSPFSHQQPHHAFSSTL